MRHSVPGRAIKRALRKIVPVRVPQPDWPALLGRDWQRFRTRLSELPLDAPRVLLIPTQGGPGITTLDSLLAVALTLRGARVHVLLCDEMLPACQNGWRDKFANDLEYVNHGPQRELCPSCFSSGQRMFDNLGVQVHRFSDFVTNEEAARARHVSSSVPLDEIPRLAVDGIDIGEHSLAGAIRYFARSSLVREPHAEAVLRRYVHAAMLSLFSTRRLLGDYGFACASFHHGIYVPQGVIGTVARASSVRVVNWAIAYRDRTFIFSHQDTYHHTLMSEPTSNWEEIPWSASLEEELVDYLKSRWDGARDWISFNRSPQHDREAIARELGIDFAKPSIGLLTNVVWDAQLHYPENAFADMIEWLGDTIRYFSGRPELQLIIRVHPAEIKGQIRSRQPVEAELDRIYPQLPPNVFVIGPESSISTYTVMMECDSVLIYGTKTGVELSSFGMPVIVAGEAWIRNKGVTRDATSKEHYRKLLDELPLGKRLTAAQMTRARRYAYHFFFRRMIPLAVVETSDDGWSPYRVAIQGLDDLAPGRDPGLDVICNGILRSQEFIYPAERLKADARTLVHQPTEYVT